MIHGHKMYQSTLSPYTWFTLELVSFVLITETYISACRMYTSIMNRGRERNGEERKKPTIKVAIQYIWNTL